MKLEALTASLRAHGCRNGDDKLLTLDGIRAVIWDANLFERCGQRTPRLRPTLALELLVPEVKP